MRRTKELEQLFLAVVLIFNTAAAFAGLSAHRLFFSPRAICATRLSRNDFALRRTAENQARSKRAMSSAAFLDPDIGVFEKRRTLLKAGPDLSAESWLTIYIFADRERTLCSPDHPLPNFSVDDPNLCSARAPPFLSLSPA